ncbi:MAG: cytochrome c3 family protein [Thermoleophilia bacterium]|nr:cytochrome c3 family protein [Thermoleophilia bacterium]
MRRSCSLGAIISTMAIILLVLPSNAIAQVSPFNGHNAATDFCIQCHDVHEARGDYQLTREATVTATCATCHGLFGALAPPYANWSDSPTNFTGMEPTASTMLAYKVSTNGMSAAEMDAIPGHTLGIMSGNTVVRELDSIPGGSSSLKVMTSGQYGGLSENLYSGEPVTSFESTKGLYCASCHTPHDTIGQLISGPGLLSSKPNHSDTVATDTLTFCLTCHDKRGTSGVEKNHPATYCLTCHDNKAGESDFPHTSSNPRLLQLEPDALCVLCHTAGSLP